MGVGTQPPIRHEHVPWLQAGVHLLHLGQSVSQEGRDHQFQEEARARMEQPQKPSDGKAAPRPLHVRLAECVLEGRRIGHRASRAIDEEGAMAPPSPFVRGGALHGVAEALQEEVKEAYWESGPGVTVGRRREP
jgi:hypothetical protein